MEFDRDILVSTSELKPFLEKGAIDLQTIQQMSYSEVEALCQELLTWKLKVGNRIHMENWSETVLKRQLDNRR